MNDLKSAVKAKLFGGKVRFRSDKRAEEVKDVPVDAPAETEEKESE